MRKKIEDKTRERERERERVKKTEEKTDSARRKKSKRLIKLWRKKNESKGD